MAKAFQSNSMPIYNGLAPGLNAYGQIENLAWTPRISVKTSNYTVKASESGTVFLAAGTAAVTFTLPPIDDGPFYFKFINAVDQNMVVAANTADTMITFNDVAADSVAFQTASEKIGGTVEVYCDGTYLVALTPIIAHSQTVTIAT